MNIREAIEQLVDVVREEVKADLLAKLNWSPEGLSFSAGHINGNGGTKKRAKFKKPPKIQVATGAPRGRKPSNETVKLLKAFKAGGDIKNLPYPVKARYTNGSKLNAKGEALLSA